MADFDVKTGYSTAFRTFVDFAEKTGKDGYDSANAKATLAGRMLTVSPLSLHETSYILRKTAEKDSNNATRDLFRQAIIDMFGGEAKIPESVKDATLGIQKAEKEDYGDGDYMWNFVPVTEGGKQVVREITDEDLDALGPAVLDFCTQ